jgi:adenylosuccinate synthase
MSVTVVVGGQFGSEGKGKVAQYLAAERDAAAVVRVGGSNSGHTGFSGDDRYVLRQLPTAALLPDVLCIIGPGAYVDPDLLLDEMRLTKLAPERLLIDERAFLITPQDKADERASGLTEAIGSTASGTGAAVARRVSRAAVTPAVRDVPELAPYAAATGPILRSLLAQRKRVIIEGTQGFGLSVLHSPHYPYATSRDTSAAGAVAEAGLSPLDVEDVALVLRTFPIRVAGNSGPLPGETSWEALTRESGADEMLSEFTSVTKKLRRVARFDPVIVRKAITVNLPTLIVMNHIDYVDAACSRTERLTEKAHAFIRQTSSEIDAPIDLVGLGPTALVPASPRLAKAIG